MTSPLNPLEFRGPWDGDDDGFLTRAYDHAPGTLPAGKTASERREYWRGQRHGIATCIVGALIGVLVAYLGAG